jgi:hypothetical protein
VSVSAAFVIYRRQLDGLPVVGGSWEWFIIEQPFAHLRKVKADDGQTQAGQNSICRYF